MPPEFAVSEAPGRQKRSQPKSRQQRREEDLADDYLEHALLFREQLEKSQLQPELKRAAFTDDWEEVMLEVKRTAKVTKAGRLETMHALVVVGNYNGIVGLGQASGSNLAQVMINAMAAAYRNLTPIPRYREHTIFHPIDTKARTVRVQMWPRPEGFGVTANPWMHALCKIAGLKNITVKLSGRRKNKRNVVNLWLSALAGQSLPHDGVECSGVYVRERYFYDKLPYRLERGVHVP